MNKENFDVEVENLDSKKLDIQEEIFDMEDFDTIRVVETCDVTETKVGAGTVSRSIILFVALFNQILSMNGMSILPIEDEVIEESVSMAFTICAAISAWWYNNSFSDAALIADDVLAKIRKSE